MLDAFYYISHILFKMIGYIMYVAPLGASQSQWRSPLADYGIKTFSAVGEP